MTTTPVARNVLLGSTPAAAYTPTASTNCWIDGLTVANTSATDVAGVEIWRGGSTSDSVALVGKTLAAGESYVVKELIGHWLLDGVSLTATAGTAAVVSFVFSGREFAVPA